MNVLDQDALASRHTLRGIELLNENTAASLAKSVACFDEAISIRRALPLLENRWLSYGLAAGWMNRGDALTRIGGAEPLEEALRSFDEALTILECLPPGENPLFRGRHAICWLNRGRTLEELNLAPEAGECYEKAQRLVRETACLPDHRVVLASALANRANVFLRQNEASAALACAEEAIVHSTALAGDAIGFAEVEAKARLIACRALALLAYEGGPSRPESVRRALDHAEDGLRLAQAWDRAGETSLRPLAAELFRFGAQAYETHQPHFLAEFAEEHARTIPSLANEAREGLSRALRVRVQRHGFATLGDSIAQKIADALGRMAKEKSTPPQDGLPSVA